MKRPVYVYAANANVAETPPLYRIRRAEAERRLCKRYVRWIDHDKVQLIPPDGANDTRDKMISGLFDQAWLPKWSAAYLVWQMRSFEGR